MKANLVYNEYMPQDEQIIQGNAVTLKETGKELHNKGYRFITGGNGTEKWVRSAKCMVRFVPKGGKELTKDIKNLIRDYYGISKISESKFNSFCDLWLNEEITLEYENGNLKII